MPKEDMIELEGIILKYMRDAKFQVELENDCKILATLSGKLRTNYIRVLPGDHVRVRVSPYDVTRGIVVWRYK